MRNINRPHLKDFRFLNRIVSNIQLLISIAKWEFQYFLSIITKLFPVNIRKLELDGSAKILIIAPHADDEWIGCSNVILSGHNVDVYYMHFFGYDYSERNKAIRDKEINECSAHFGFNLFFAGDDMFQSLLNVIKREYQYVFIPSPFDWHWEHRLTDKLVSDVFHKFDIKNCRIFYYSISVPIVENTNLYYIPLCKKESKKKWDTFKCIYGSQIMPIKRYILQEKLNAMDCQDYSCELYKELSLSQLFEDVSKMCGFAPKYDELVKCINNIYTIRKTSKHIGRTFCMIF